MLTFAQFEAVAALVPYQPKGMFYSEVYFFLQVCSTHHVKTILESGVKWGMSTRLLGATFPGTIMAVEQTPLIRSVPGVQLLEGDSTIMLPRLVRRFAPTESVGVLIDGPKGARGLQLKDDCLRAGAKVVGVHDQESGHGESKHTHTAPAFLDLAESLDRFVSDEYRRKYPRGSGLAIWERT